MTFSLSVKTYHSSPYATVGNKEKKKVLEGTVSRGGVNPLSRNLSYKIETEITIIGRREGFD